MEKNIWLNMHVASQNFFVLPFPFWKNWYCISLFTVFLIGLPYVFQIIASKSKVAMMNLILG